MSRSHEMQVLRLVPARRDSLRMTETFDGRYGERTPESGVSFGNVKFYESASFEKGVQVGNEKGTI